MKKTIKILATLVIVFTLSFNLFMTPSYSNDGNDFALSDLIEINTASASSAIEGPLCSNSGGTIYCCKGTDGSCSAGAKCSSCQ